MTITINNKPYTPKLSIGQAVWVTTSYYEFMQGVVDDIVLTIQQDGAVKVRYNVTCINENNEAEGFCDLDEDDVCATELDVRYRQLHYWSIRKDWLQSQLDEWDTSHNDILDRIIELETADVQQH